MELTREERLKNAIGTFAVSDLPLYPQSGVPAHQQSGMSIIRNRTIILLDDVKTTGATLEEAARVLRKAGARRVWAVTIAH